MSAYNGSGAFVISGTGLPYVTGTVISSTVANQLNTDLATGLSTALTKDGQTTPTGNIPLGGFKLTGVALATAVGDALSYGRAATVAALTATSGTYSTSVTAGTFTANGAGGGTIALTGFGFTNTIGTRDYLTNDGSGITMQCVSGGVVLSNGATSWAAASERTVKKNLEDIKGDPLAIIAAHTVKIGHYLGDADDAPKQPFLFYEDAIAHFPEAAVTRPEVIRTDTAGVTETIPEFNGIMYDKYIPLLMAGMQKLTERVAALEALTIP